MSTTYNNHVERGGGGWRKKRANLHISNINNYYFDKCFDYSALSETDSKIFTILVQMISNLYLLPYLLVLFIGTTNSAAKGSWLRQFKALHEGEFVSGLASLQLAPPENF